MPDSKPGFNEQFCPSCGEIVNEQAPHCPNCGHPISPRNQESGGASSEEVELGYETIDEKREQRIKQAKEVGDSLADSTDSWLPVAKHIGLWGVGLFLFLAGLGSFSSPDGSLVAGIVLVLVGLFTLPPVHGHIGRDADPLSFGSRRIVEESSIVDSTQPCVVCASPVDEGVERTRVKQLLVFGGAISSTSEGRSVYCQECARGEVVNPHDGESARSEDTPVESENQAE